MERTFRTWYSKHQNKIESGAINAQKVLDTFKAMEKAGLDKETVRKITSQLNSDERLYLLDMLNALAEERKIN
jgi:hypothetical protein